MQCAVHGELVFSFQGLLVMLRFLLPVNEYKKHYHMFYSPGTIPLRTIIQPL
jgi:hypothetical protein